MNQWKLGDVHTHDEINIGHKIVQWYDVPYNNSNKNGRKRCSVDLYRSISIDVLPHFDEITQFFGVLAENCLTLNLDYGSSRAATEPERRRIKRGNCQAHSRHGGQIQCRTRGRWRKWARKVCWWPGTLCRSLSLFDKARPKGHRLHTKYTNAHNRDD